MSHSKKSPARPRRLFPRSAAEVLRAATQPILDQKGKLYGALLRDWERIAGDARAAISRPMRLQFPASQASGGILHLQVAAHAAPALAYEETQILEACARHFGYRAIERVVLHPSYDWLNPPAQPPSQQPAPEAPAAATSATQPPLPAEAPATVREALARIAALIKSPDTRA